MKIGPLIYLIRLLETKKGEPAVLSQESFDLLNELRKFRHFLRHAYSVELDLNSLRRLKDMVREKFVVVERDLDNFREYLEGELKKKLEEVA